jgi:hypothetical protein
MTVQIDLVTGKEGILSGQSASLITVTEQLAFIIKINNIPGPGYFDFVAIASGCL